jgi:hypothetical protein
VTGILLDSECQEFIRAGRFQVNFDWWRSRPRATTSPTQFDGQESMISTWLSAALVLNLLMHGL